MATGQDVDYYEFYFKCQTCNHRFKYLRDAMEHTDPGIYKGYLHNITIELGHTTWVSDAKIEE
jgi:hypothetical protein